jgi:hypothetical protein
VDENERAQDGGGGGEGREIDMEVGVNEQIVKTGSFRIKNGGETAPSPQL